MGGGVGLRGAWVGVGEGEGEGVFVDGREVERIGAKGVRDKGGGDEDVGVEFAVNGSPVEGMLACWD